MVIPTAKEHLGGPCRLALEDGALFTGQAFGAVGQGGLRTAEVVFNTAMTGYQEALTDPSYAGQILVMTAPLIGNYGVNSQDVESDRVQVTGFVVRELARAASNCAAEQDLASHLAAHGALGVTGIDTRALTRRLRIEGAMRGALSDDPSVSDAELVRAAREAPTMTGRNLVPLVGVREMQQVYEARDPRALRIWTLDCGVKRNILRMLADRGCAVRAVPHQTPADQLLRAWREGEFDGLLVSNGPGDPAAVDVTIASLRELLTKAPELPVFGICLGHQLLALALGGSTYKLPFGHRGVNHPVRVESTGRVEITSQNHGFAVEASSLARMGAELTHLHLNDGSVAGFRLPGRPVFAVQHHPEASPGPHDSSHLFDEFVACVQRQREVRGGA